MALESALGKMERYMKVWKELNRHIVLLTCYDYRLDVEAFGVSRQRLSAIVRRIKSDVPLNLIVHVADLRGLELQGAVVIVKDRTFWRRALEIRSLEDIKSSFPFGGFLSRITLSLGSTVILTYVVPPNLRDEMLGILEKLASRFNGQLYFGELVPVRNCVGRLGLAEELVEKLGKLGREVLEKKPNPYELGSKRFYLLNLIITSLLDDNPFIGIKDLTKAANLMLARPSGVSNDAIAELRFRLKYVRKQYHVLSKAGVVGRIRVRPPMEALPMLIIAEKEAYEKLYGITASQLMSTRILVSSSNVVSAIAIPYSPTERKMLANFLEGVKADFYPGIATATVPLPVEYYDPWSHEWRKEPTDLVRALRRAGILER